MQKTKNVIGFNRHKTENKKGEIKGGNTVVFLSPKMI
jgi:hypothetical protein